MSETEFDRERTVVERLYGRLDELRLHTAERLASVRAQVVGGGHQARTERDAFARLYEDRLLALRDVDQRLVFGRLHMQGATAAPPTSTNPASTTPASTPPTSTSPGSTPPASTTPTSTSPTHPTNATAPTQADAIRYVGRIDLRDEEQRGLLLDWRAPQASAFYQATAANPLGVRVRRHLTLKGRELTRIDDEVFDANLLDADSQAAGVEIQGEGALLAAVTSQRTGRMHDIVATIQAEQDRIIRSDPRGALVVQGGPGTGKTAVALHRAAYLLYTYRERLGSAGVLVVGPSPVFLEYISAVLPALGESGVVLQSLGELLPGVTATRNDRPEVAALKGDVEMAKLIRRAVRSRQRMPRGVQVIDVNGEQLEVEPQLIGAAMRRAQASGKPHNAARVIFVKHALNALTEKLVAQLRAQHRTIDDDDVRALREDIRTSHDARVVLNTAWLPLSAEKLVRDLFARPQWLAELTGHWSREKRALLARDRGEPFTIEDVPLLDEAAELLGDAPAGPSASHAEAERQRRRDLENARQAIRNAGAEGVVSAEQLVERFEQHGESLTTAERAASDRTWTYGHIVVDEAQELSPMQWRLLVRRCPLRSFTIVGDIAQAASASAAGSWGSALARPFGDRWRVETLTVNYRTPAQVTREAERLAAEHGLPVTPTRAVREGEWPVETLEGDVRRTVVDAVSRVRDDGTPGTIAVISPPNHVDAVTRALESRFGADVAAGLRALDRPISVITPHESKGLEFDSVVLVDPDAVLRGGPRGASDLYVAMTRPTQRLLLVRPA